jgi:hypothetical protein
MTFQEELSCYDDTESSLTNDSRGMDPSCIAPSGLENDGCYICSQGVALGCHVLPLRGVVYDAPL